MWVPAFPCLPPLHIQLSSWPAYLTCGNSRLNNWHSSSNCIRLNSFNFLFYITHCDVYYFPLIKLWLIYDWIVYFIPSSDTHSPTHEMHFEDSYWSFLPINSCLFSSLTPIIPSSVLYVTSFPVLYHHDDDSFLVVLYPFYNLLKMLNAVNQVVCDQQRDTVDNSFGWISKFTKTKGSLSWMAQNIHVTKGHTGTLCHGISPVFSFTAAHQDLLGYCICNSCLS